ncbi:MAG: DNA repair protein RadC [Holosporales bacterium]|jgi:DNA repair protein RadC|nr:DNA repair protein RadC [Holosporales bacterium]
MRINSQRNESIAKEKEKQQKGHRARLCEKLITGANDNLLDYEIVELMLFLIIKRKDTKPIAKNLIAKFKSIDKIISASKEELLTIDGVGESTFKALRIIDAVIKSVVKSKMAKRNVVDCFEDVLNYCKCYMKNLIEEELRIIFLNSINEVIKDDIIKKGSINEIEASPRMVVKTCIENGASGFVLVHNHPSGDPTPSQDDIYVTKKIKEAAEVFNIKLHDHIIIGGDRAVSFRNLLIIK